MFFARKLEFKNRSDFLFLELIFYSGNSNAKYAQHDALYTS